MRTELLILFVFFYENNTISIDFLDFMTVFTIIEVLDLFSYVKNVQQIIILFVMIYKLLCGFLTFWLFDIRIDLQIYIT